MKASVEALLEPIAADAPCGVDIGYDPDFLELDTILQGKPETQFSSAEDPDWKAVMNRCLELFDRSKDLRVSVRLTLAWMKSGGLPGFHRGLQVLKGLIAQYWDPVFPRLDPDDGNDPLERVNILSSLATPAGTYGDPLQIIGRLRQAPLAESPQLGKISMVDVERSVSGAAADGQTPVSASQVQAAFRSTPPERLQEIYAAITGAQACVKELDDLLTSIVGSNQAVAFDSLASTLKDLQKVVAPHASPGEVVADEGGEQVGAVASEGGHSEGPAISGAIRSRQDVVRVIDQICEFYRRTEPSSPVPLILLRARRMVNMDFVQLLMDLAPESLNQINVITGMQADSVPAS